MCARIFTSITASWDSSALLSIVETSSVAFGHEISCERERGSHFLSHSLSWGGRHIPDRRGEGCPFSFHLSALFCLWDDLLSPLKLALSHAFSVHSRETQEWHSFLHQVTSIPLSIPSSLSLSYTRCSFVWGDAHPGLSGPDWATFLCRCLVSRCCQCCWRYCFDCWYIYK